MGTKLRMAVAGLVFGVMLAGCKDGAKHERPVIAVSVAPQAALVEAIAGEDYDVVTILDRGANPETFEPGMQTRIAADNAKAYLSLGGLLPFEKALTESLSDKVVQFDTSKGIELEYGTHGDAGHRHDDNDGADPHVWTSIVNIAVMADNISEFLCELNPKGAQHYAMKTDSLMAVLDCLDENFREKLKEAPSQAFAVWHPSLSYFARDYNLKQIALGQEHKELSAMRLKELCDSATGEGTRVFFLQREFDPRQASTANERIGSRLVRIDPLSDDWAGQLTMIVDELTKR
ncbi:MAG: zinc ABC transporter substrate-binding protein [Muribaculaceae bacterium]|nr:zinc ABC transporter substrate-binding protein [Muribaculaceae bacterium]